MNDFQKKVKPQHIHKIYKLFGASATIEIAEIIPFIIGNKYNSSNTFLHAVTVESTQAQNKHHRGEPSRKVNSQAVTGPTEAHTGPAGDSARTQRTKRQSIHYQISRYDTLIRISCP